MARELESQLAHRGEVVCVPQVFVRVRVDLPDVRGEHAARGGDEDGGAAAEADERGGVLPRRGVGLPDVFGGVRGEVVGVAVLEQLQHEGAWGGGGDGEEAFGVGVSFGGDEVRGAVRDGGAAVLRALGGGAGGAVEVWIGGGGGWECRWGGVAGREWGCDSWG